MMNKAMIGVVLEYRGRDSLPRDVEVVRSENSKCLVRFLYHPKKYSYWVSEKTLYPKKL
jgi:hypothetical protein